MIYVDENLSYVVWWLMLLLFHYGVDWVIGKYATNLKDQGRNKEALIWFAIGHLVIIDFAGILLAYFMFNPIV